MTSHSASDPQPTTPRHPRKDSDHDRNHHHRTEHDGHTSNGDNSSGSNRGAPQRGRQSGSRKRSNTDGPQRDRQSAPARGRQQAVSQLTPGKSDRPVSEASEGITSKAGAASARRGLIPTPEQWAQQQLEHAPQRSRAWAGKVASIYGLDVPDEG